jgi:hypothetical protein
MNLTGKLMTSLPAFSRKICPEIDLSPLTSTLKFPNYNTTLKGSNKVPRYLYISTFLPITTFLFLYVFQF